MAVQRPPSTAAPSYESSGRYPPDRGIGNGRPVIKQEPPHSPTLSFTRAVPRYDSAAPRERSSFNPALANGHAVVSNPRQSRLDGPRTAVFSISDETWARVFQHLTPRVERYPNRRPKFVDLSRASHVCHQWRNVILSTPSFWSTLCGLSVGELNRFDELIARAGRYAVTVDIDFMTTGRVDYKKLCGTLVQHMSHIAKLSLRLRSDRMAAWYALTPVLGTRAPLLESLHISFPGSGVVLPIMLFNMHAPKLLSVTAHIQLLPAGCPAFSQVMHFTALDDERNPLEEETRRLMDVCPQLDSLSLNAPLLDAPLNDGYKGTRQHFRSLEEHYGGKRVLKQLQVTDSGERESPPRSRMDREPYNAPHRIRLVVPTLQLFQHIDIPTVHVVSACQDTFKFVHRRLGVVKHVAFVPALDNPDVQMVLIDKDNRARVFSRALPSFLYNALRRTDLFKEIQSLTVGEYAAVQDWDDLFTTPLPTLVTLSVVMSPPQPTSSSFMHIFEAANTNRWACVALKTLRFCTKEPMIDLGLPGLSPLTISAAGMLRFLHRGLQLGTPKLPELVLDGVVFAEGGAGRDVTELKKAVASVILRR
ncbi:hypothetical protein AURDEDRAFT_159348 [Auricularia subglabra TFB-10046 SS5]|nr:hypothetical protein AURDEDRAFT_159348 [Auricularia subglabra TFB-10046 SS5]